jgi:hypothetical protein
MFCSAEVELVLMTLQSSVEQDWEGRMSKLLAERLVMLLLLKESVWTIAGARHHDVMGLLTGVSGSFDLEFSSKDEQK